MEIVYGTAAGRLRNRAAPGGHIVAIVRSNRTSPTAGMATHDRNDGVGGRGWWPGVQPD